MTDTNRLSVFAVILSFISVSSSNSCQFNVEVFQDLRNDGFHRNLTYEVVFKVVEDERWLLSDCVVGLDQTLPPGVYVNTDELQDLRRSSRVKAVPKNRVNIELPAEQSNPSSVYVMGELVDDKAKLWLPVHARYHQATQGGGFATNTIEAPKLFLRCPNDRLAACENFQDANILCDISSKKICTWKAIPFSLVSRLVTWRVPVGNTEHYQLVSLGTAAAVILGSIHILRTVHVYMTRKKKQN